MKTSALLCTLASVANAAVIWDGRFNDLSNAKDLDTWSWSNQVGPYQYYIHGSGDVNKYIALSSDYKNPADTSSKQGAKFTLDGTSFWNGQTMRRTELIPQTKAAIASGKVFYHFSIMRKATNAPSVNREHQICFFESHFTELKSGWISGEAGESNPNLQWMTSQQSHWKTEWTADVWHNVAYEIVSDYFPGAPVMSGPAKVTANIVTQDFGANTVGFWHSEGADDLKQVVAPVSTSTSSNGQDWHLGVLELPRSGYSDSNEDFYFSGVYIETGPITTSVSGPGKLPQIQL